jgi:acyl carrier protein
MTTEVGQQIKDFILNEFLPGEDPAELTPDTPLISGGILDSIATLRLLMFMEETWGVTFEPHEVDKENLDTLSLIERLLASKQQAAAR